MLVFVGLVTLIVFNSAQLPSINCNYVASSPLTGQYHGVDICLEQDLSGSGGGFTSIEYKCVGGVGYRIILHVR